MIREIQLDDKQVILLGTAHVSAQSVKDVNDAIATYAPDSVCIELDQSRLDTLKDSDSWKELDIFKAIEQGKGNLLLLQTVLAIYQRRMGEEFDIEPGSEMLEAYDLAVEQELDTHLIDRDINETLSRVFSELSLWEKTELVTKLLFSEQEELEIDDITEKEIHKVMEHLGEDFPRLKSIFVDERDAYMADKIRDTEGDTVLAVVGAGHVNGIADCLTSDAPAPEPVPERWFSVMKALKYGIPSLIIGLFLYGGFVMGATTAREMFTYWFFINAFCAAAGAIVSRGHPVTIVTSFLAAPFTSVNPALPAGLVAAYVENLVRPPRVTDLEGLRSLVSFTDIWSNRATRLLLIFMMVNVGSAIATFVGAGFLVNIIS